MDNVHESALDGSEVEEIVNKTKSKRIKKERHVGQQVALIKALNISAAETKKSSSSPRKLKVLEKSSTIYMAAE